MDAADPSVVRRATRDSFDPTSFDSPIVKSIAPPLVAALGIAFSVSPFGFLLEGFHVWIHELGHASVAWFSGRPAIPLPVGWTNVEPDKSLTLYFVMLVVLVALGATGSRERKAWPMILAAALIGAQAFMTWRISDERAHLWIIFAGVGGEFYLSAAMVCLFFFEFPERFRWGSCRYVVLFIGAASFFETYSFWKKVKRGLEGIPYGSMINGEDDGGGDMNILADNYHWTQHRIMNTYGHLGDICLASIVVVYLYFNFRLDRAFHPFLARCFSIGLKTNGDEH